MPSDSLESMITDTFKEAERLLSCNSVMHQVRSSQQPNKVSPSIVNGSPSVAKPLVPPYTGTVKESERFRRPQHDDEYWSVSSKSWSNMSYARREMLSHVGRINETSDGQQARNDCSKCADNGSECMIYRDLAGSNTMTSTGGSACSRCRYRRLACSFEAVIRTTIKKRKGADHRVDEPKSRKSAKHGRMPRGR